MKTVRVFEVLHDIEVPGPAGDYCTVARFLSNLAAVTFAAGVTCYGKPATVSVEDVPRRLAERWGCA